MLACFKNATMRKIHKSINKKHSIFFRKGCFRKNNNSEAKAVRIK